MTIINHLLYLYTKAAKGSPINATNQIISYILHS